MISMPCEVWGPCTPDSATMRGHDSERREELPLRLTISKAFDARFAQHALGISLEATCF